MPIISTKHKVNKSRMLISFGLLMVVAGLVLVGILKRHLMLWTKCLISPIWKVEYWKSCLLN